MASSRRPAGRTPAAQIYDAARRVYAAEGSAAPNALENTAATLLAQVGKASAVHPQAKASQSAPQTPQQPTASHPAPPPPTNTMQSEIQRLAASRNATHAQQQKIAQQLGTKGLHSEAPAPPVSGAQSGHKALDNPRAQPETPNRARPGSRPHSATPGSGKRRMSYDEEDVSIVSDGESPFKRPRAEGAFQHLNDIDRRRSNSPTTVNIYNNNHYYFDEQAVRRVENDPHSYRILHTLLGQSTIDDHQQPHSERGGNPGVDPNTGDGD